MLTSLAAAIVYNLYSCSFFLWFSFSNCEELLHKEADWLLTCAYVLIH